jgi:chemotaxis protein methyltransferase CheR
MGTFYLDKIREYVFQRSRLSFAGHKKGVLRQRLENRIGELGLPDLAAYWDYLLRTAEEERRLFDILTTNETFFFRDPLQFRYLRETILPALEQARGMELLRAWGEGAAPTMKLRILCAGCASGEEPYSVAMTILETLRYPRAWDVEIVAGDLSESCLEAAIEGHYGEDRLKGVPADYIDRYMTRSGKGAVMGEEVKRLVRFVHLNLNDVMTGGEIPGAEEGSAGFDVIFCRNVMIYFSPPCQQLLVDTLYRLLAPGGHLFTGDAEPLHLFRHSFVAVRESGCLVYRKTEIQDDVKAL